MVIMKTLASYWDEARGILFSDVQPVAEGWSALARTSAESSPVLIFLRAPTSGRPVCIRICERVVCIALYSYRLHFGDMVVQGLIVCGFFLNIPLCLQKKLTVF